MIRIALWATWALILATPLVSAQLHDVEISAQRTKLDESKERSRGNTTTTTKEIAYNLTLKSKSFKNIPQLDIKYMIFYEDAQAGSSDRPTLASITGSETLHGLEARAKVEIQTKPITLSTDTLDAGWYYTTGGSNKSKDRVKGLWIRVFSEGKMVGEYENPSTLSNKYDWKE